MCGIFGIVDSHQDSVEASVYKALKEIDYRGPNDQGVFLSNLAEKNIGLGHVRLSVQDLTGRAHQPMHFENLTIIYNGEVYNFAEIKHELIGLGYRFESDSDTEVILKAYHCWGEECLTKFRGMFAFAILDLQRKEIFMARDRVGVKPLYYSHVEDRFVFGSELKTITCHSTFDRVINPRALSSYFRFGYINSNESIFSNINKLPPGHLLRFDLVRSELMSSRYWALEDYYSSQSETMTYEEAIENVEREITSSCMLRMVSDVPVGVFLSGGVDSSLVASILQAHGDFTCRTFTLGFDDPAYDESEYAKAVASNLGTEHSELTATKEDALSVIRELPCIYDEPFADSSSIPTILVSRLAADSVSVVLSGDGGDEMFCGYSAYHFMPKRYGLIKGMPFGKSLIKLASALSSPNGILHNLNEGIYTKVQKARDLSSTENIADAYRLSNSVFTSSELKYLLRDKPKELNEISLIGPSDYESMMLSDFSGYLPDDLLVKVDRATMSVSLEGREPLLDHKILECAAQIPIEHKVGKKVLKDILAKYLPRDLFERRKQGFGLPINEWLRTDLQELLDEFLSREAIERVGVFRAEYVLKLKDMFLSGKNDDRKIWTVLVFQMWAFEYLLES
ncbi:Asparagine synthetase [glutamine-hydrolyzing] 1 [BD1-7 clade bacterium]|uniref:asparagine synthase (glutamine-hydrolyzing) n=1 Tax=BD1-7 clade bacterium TaxID=2029982 RepID=A0A5S9N2C4_9GAMM|nr:Asparagine synthetase [glutamine-hydrolyzing] 1 [BD1-7 clade bacterium]CAA0083809.1 Asparagine synthetase [glutamine-hydrolyzing] 1 [BD1-7 clade bacterium]